MSRLESVQYTTCMLIFLFVWLANLHRLLLHPHALAQPLLDLFLDFLIGRFACSARNQRGLRLSRGLPKPRGFSPRIGEDD
jgi:hypothetical protein